MATPMKTRLENISSRIARNLYYFVIIPIRSTCTMRPNYSATEQVGTVSTENEQHLKFGHFTLLFFRGRRRNVSQAVVLLFKGPPTTTSLCGRAGRWPAIFCNTEIRVLGKSNFIALHRRIYMFQ